MSTGLTPKIHKYMGDARHKRAYPDGERIQMTDRWKQKVRDRLTENKQNGVSPRDQSELADAVGAGEKSAITKMFKAKSSKFVPAICRVLQIPMPMLERQEPDDLERLIGDADQKRRDRIARLIAASGL